MWLTCIASPCCICCHAVLKSDTKRRCWGWQRALMLTISRVQEMTMRNGILRLFLPSTNGMACIGGGKGPKGFANKGVGLTQKQASTLHIQNQRYVQSGHEPLRTGHTTFDYDEKTITATLLRIAGMGPGKALPFPVGELN